MIAVLLALGCAASPGPAQSGYEEDLEFALERVEQECRELLRVKEVDWKRLARELRKAAREVGSDREMLVLLQRLVAALEDGHARVERREATEDLAWPEDGSRFDRSVPRGHTGMAWCRIGKRIHVKAVAGPAGDAGLVPGSQVIAVDGERVDDWLEERIAAERARISWSTDHQAFFWMTHWGLDGPEGGRLKIRVREPDGRKKNRTISLTGWNGRMAGPAAWPEGLEGEQDVFHARLDGGWGYVYVRRCKGDLPGRMDAALRALGDAPGLVIDFRGNSGGGFDHDALLGRFVPAGERLTFAKTIASAGPSPYGGPVVVIVDGTVVSAGETASGMFKEEGRAYLIGESPTAGMSSQKTTIELPSGKWALYVSVRSNKARWQDGRGVEGIGVEPHEIVEYQPEDLATGVDTLVRVACERLADFPQREVPYEPADFGWSAPEAD